MDKNIGIIIIGVTVILVLAAAFVVGYKQLNSNE